MIEVNISTLEQDTTGMEEKIAHLKERAEELNTIMDELNKMWEAASKDIFLAKVEKSKARLGDLLKEAEAYAGKMDNAVTVYRNCEAAVGQEVDAIRV